MQQIWPQEDMNKQLELMCKIKKKAKEKNFKFGIPASPSKPGEKSGTWRLFTSRN